MFHAREARFESRLLCRAGWRSYPVRYGGGESGRARQTCSIQGNGLAYGWQLNRATDSATGRRGNETPRRCNGDPASRAVGDRLHDRQARHADLPSHFLMAFVYAVTALVLFRPSSRRQTPLWALVAAASFVECRGVCVVTVNWNRQSPLEH